MTFAAVAPSNSCRVGKDGGDRKITLRLKSHLQVVQVHHPPSDMVTIILFLNLHNRYNPSLLYSISPLSSLKRKSLRTLFVFSGWGRWSRGSLSLSSVSFSHSSRKWCWFSSSLPQSLHSLSSLFLASNGRVFDLAWKSTIDAGVLSYMGSSFIAGLPSGGSKGGGGHMGHDPPPPLGARGHHRPARGTTGLSGAPQA